jgi:hypothetical protein
VRSRCSLRQDNRDVCCEDAHAHLLRTHQAHLN